MNNLHKLATSAQIAAFTGVMALCFQPLAKKYDFKHGIAKNEDGKFIFINDKAVMENDLITVHKHMYKLSLKKQYGDNWRHVWKYGHLPHRV